LICGELVLCCFQLLLFVSAERMQWKPCLWSDATILFSLISE